MSDIAENIATEEEELNDSAITFNNLVILKEFGNIVDKVRNEDFLEAVPTAKLKRVKWVPMFDYIKQRLFDEMVQSMTLLWQEENMPEKLEILEKQKEKFADINADQHLWRPQLGDVKAQLRASDVAKLQKQKVILETLAEEYERRVNTLKKTISAKRGYLKALQMDIQKYQKKNEECIEKMDQQFINHENIVNIVLEGKVQNEELNWQKEDIQISSDSD